MKVVLLTSVKKLGAEGDIIEVSSGYARNFLFPHGYAEAATEKAIQRVKKEKERVVTRAEKDLVKTQKLVARIDGREIQIQARASGLGTLFAAVHEKNIAHAIYQQLNVNVAPEAIEMKDIIKEVGDYSVRAHFDHGLEAIVTVRVTEG